MSSGLGFATAAAIALMEIALDSGTATEDGTADINYEVKPIILPGATGAVALDYFAHDRATGKVWVPASNTGSVDVIDGNTDAVSQITGFPTGEIERRGRKIDRKSTRLNSSHSQISYAVFCLKKKKK